MDAGRIFSRIIYSNMRLSRKSIGLNDPIRIGLHMGIKTLRFLKLRQQFGKTKFYSGDEHGILSENQSVILQVFSNEFCRRSKKDPNVSVRQAIPLSRNIFALDSEWMTREVTDDDVLQMVQQIGLLKAQGRTVCMLYFYHRWWSIIGKDIYRMGKYIMGISLRNLIKLMYQKKKIWKKLMTIGLLTFVMFLINWFRSFWLIDYTWSFKS